MSQYREERKELILNDLTSLSAEAISEIEFKEGELYITNETLDTTPTKGSSNLVTSDGIYTAIEDVKSTINTDVSSLQSTLKMLTIDKNVISSAIATFPAKGSIMNKMSGTVSNPHTSQKVMSNRTVMSYTLSSLYSSSTLHCAYDGNLETEHRLIHTSNYTDLQYLKLYTAYALKIKSLHVSFSFIYPRRQAATVALQGSNDDTNWTTLYQWNVTTSSGLFSYDVTLNYSQFYKYHRIARTYPVSISTYDDVTAVYEIYTKEYEYQAPAKKNELTCNSLDTSKLRTGDKVTIKTNSYDITNIYSNTLNGKSVNTILQPSTIYELIYDGTQFVDMKNLKITVGTLGPNSSISFEKTIQCAIATNYPDQSTYMLRVDGCTLHHTATTENYCHYVAFF